MSNRREFMKTLGVGSTALVLGASTPNEENLNDMMVKKLVKYKWVETHMSTIRKKDVISVFFPEWTAYENKIAYVAVSDAFKTEEGIWSVDANPLPFVKINVERDGKMIEICAYEIRKDDVLTVGELKRIGHFESPKVFQGLNN